MAGFGSMSFGLGPYSIGSPEAAPAQATGSVGSRWIDPATRDYAYNSATNNLKQMPGVRQQVLLAVMTIQGSANPNPRFGVRMPNKMNNTFEAECKASAVAALRHLTDPDPAIIKVNNIKVTKGRNSRAEILIDYIDLTTGESDQVSSQVNN